MNVKENPILSDNERGENKKEKMLTKLATSKYGQDGAIFGNTLFRFDHLGNCSVYDIEELLSGGERSLSPISEFTLDRADEITPHGNAVCFGSEYYTEGDEFPLLYNNIYNNYAKAEDRLVGVCCVYRIFRTECGFSSELVGLIRIGFTEDCIWRSDGVDDVRPYGNFVIDRERGRLYAYVMRDADKTTRYFSFALPSIKDGKKDSRFRVKTVTLEKCDILEYFDTSYHNFIQGGIARDGRVYEVEGFNSDIHPAVRIVDFDERREVLHVDFCLEGFETEAEMIDFLDNALIYSDAHGVIYKLEV